MVFTVVLLMLVGLFGLTRWEVGVDTGSSGTNAKPSASKATPQSGAGGNASERSHSQQSASDTGLGGVLVAQQGVRHREVLAQVPASELLVMVFPEEGEQQEDLKQEYQQLLGDAPEYEQLLMADKPAWDRLVEKVAAGELDPNAVLGEKVQQFEHSLRMRLARESGESSEEQGLEPEVVLQTVFDKALVSRETRLSHIRKLLKYGATPNSAQVKNILLAAMEEPDKLKKIQVLIEKGVDIRQSPPGMTPLDATMVWGDVTVAKYLIHKGARPDVDSMRKVAEAFQPAPRLRQSQAYLSTMAQ